MRTNSELLENEIASSNTRLDSKGRDQYSSKRTMIQILSAVVKAVRLEPMMVFYYTALALTTVTGQNLLLQKACHPGSTVPPMTSHCPNEVEAQKTITNIQTWRDFIVLSVSILFIFFAGPWSDNHGKRRKPLIYLPICGQIISDLLCILNVYFWEWSPVTTAIFQSVPPALTGWRACFSIGVMSYMADVTTEANRTVRLGVCAAVYFLSIPIGGFTFGLIFHRVGFYGVFILCVVMNTLALLHLCMFVTESACDSDKPKVKAWEALFDRRHIVQSIETIFSPREGYRRAILLLSIVAAPITIASLQGESSIIYFFLRYKFDWDESDYGFYASYKCLVICGGTLVTLGIFSRLLKLSDVHIGILASIALMIAALGYTFVHSTWQLFLYPVIDFTHGAGLTVVYSIASKNVDQSELGQVNSMIGVADAFFPLINLPLYNQVYHQTLSFMPGAFFLLSAMYGAIGLILFTYVYGHDTTASVTFDEADNLLYAAEKYMMEPLKARISSHLMTLLSPDNICQLLNNPACYRLLELQSTITEILQCETARVLESPAFLSLNLDGFMKILEQEAMNVEEIQVWRSAVKWGTHRGGTEEGKVLREQLSEPLKQIRVCTISLENFLQEVVPTRILNDTSVTMVCLYHGKKEKQAELVQVSNETKPRMMKTSILKTSTKLLETVYVKMPLQFNFNLKYSYVLLLTKRKFGVELLPLEFTANDPMKFVPEGLTYQCDCTVEITEITDYVENTSTKPPVTVRFCQQVEYGSVFQVPLTSNGENIRLLPNTKYKLSVEFTEPHTMYRCIQRTVPSVSNEHMELEFQHGRHGWWYSPVKGLRYKPIQQD